MHILVKRVACPLFDFQFLSPAIFTFSNLTPFESLIKLIPYAETLEECERLKKAFAGRYEKDYPKAVEKLRTDWDRMVTFYSFPKEHWVHLRTTNVVESPFSSVRLRTDAAKRFKKVQNATAMIWKLLQVAEKSFRTLKGHWLLRDVYAGKEFVNGTASLLPRLTAGAGHWEKTLEVGRETFLIQHI